MGRYIVLKPEGKRFVAVTWKDPNGQGRGALAEHELPHCSTPCTTYGWLMKEDSSGVSVAPEVLGDATFRDVTYIPTELITEPICDIPLPKRKRIKKSKSTIETAPT